MGILDLISGISCIYLCVLLVSEILSKILLYALTLKHIFS